MLFTIRAAAIVRHVLRQANSAIYEKLAALGNLLGLYLEERTFQPYVHALAATNRSILWQDPPCQGHRHVPRPLNHTAP